MGRADDFTPVRTPGLPPGLMSSPRRSGFTKGALDVTFDSSLIEKAPIR